MKKNKPVTPLPFAWYAVPVVALATAGLLDSVYLSISHFRVYTDMGYKSFCAVSKSLNCDTVSQSPYSIFMDIPVPVWGVIGYLFFLFVLLTALRQTKKTEHLWGVLFFLALIFSICSVILGIISAYMIQSYCIMCIVSFAVCFLLLFYTWLICRRFVSEKLLECIKSDFRYLLSNKRMSLLFVLFFGVLCVSGWLLPDYWHFEKITSPREINQGVTDDGHPWIGAENPELVITEFSDYRCFQCRKMHFFLRDIVAAHENKIRLVHKHFPMDSDFNSVLVNQPFHEGSGELSMIAVYAQLKGSFWEMNDILYNLPRNVKTIDLRRIAEQSGMNRKNLAAAIRSEKIRKILSRDIWEGMKLRITGTPSYVIDGKVYTGNIPADVFKKYIKD